MSPYNQYVVLAGESMDTKTMHFATMEDYQRWRMNKRGARGK